MSTGPGLEPPVDRSGHTPLSGMKSQSNQTEVKSTVAPAPAITSCRKKKKDDANFLEDVKDHIDEFISASMDEHKTCFKKTIQKDPVQLIGNAILQRSAAQPRPAISTSTSSISANKWSIPSISCYYFGL